MPEDIGTDAPFHATPLPLGVPAEVILAIQTVVRAEVYPLQKQLTRFERTVGERLVAGDKDISQLRKDVDFGLSMCRKHGALEPKAVQQATTEIHPRKKKIETWQVILLTAVLSGIGSTYGPVLFQKVVDALATKPVVASRAGT